MSNRNKLRDKINPKIHQTYKKLTERGINFAARYPVYRQVLALTGADKHKRTPGTMTVIPEKTLELVVQKLEVGNVTSYREGMVQTVGDARFVTPQHELIKADLDGSSLPENEKIRYEINGDYYTPVNGGIQDRDGLAWRVTLKRVS